MIKVEEATYKDVDVLLNCIHPNSKDELDVLQEDIEDTLFKLFEASTFVYKGMEDENILCVFGTIKDEFWLIMTTHFRDTKKLIEVIKRSKMILNNMLKSNEDLKFTIKKKNYMAIKWAKICRLKYDKDIDMNGHLFSRYLLCV